MANEDEAVSGGACPEFVYKADGWYSFLQYWHYEKGGK